ncbi:hypothetical protein RS030_111889 [Cryptosporidium xiaoi]|uniref:Zinc finger protein n=1 Tax=Cryptosporidium xiaoi TaxID=659607 RepID=A0AAV9Y226_9CRYT
MEDAISIKNKVCGEISTNNEIKGRKKKRKKKQIDKTIYNDNTSENSNIKVEKISENKSTSYGKMKRDKFKKQSSFNKSIDFLIDKNNSINDNTDLTNTNNPNSNEGKGITNSNKKKSYLNTRNKGKQFSNKPHNSVYLNKEKNSLIKNGTNDVLPVNRVSKLKRKYNYPSTGYFCNTIDLQGSCYSWKKEWERLLKLYNVSVIEDRRLEQTICEDLITGEFTFLISFNPSDPDFPFDCLREYNFNETINSDKYSINMKFTIQEGYPKNIENLKVELPDFDNISSIFNESFRDLIISTKNSLYPIYDALKLFDRKITEIVNIKLPPSNSLWEHIIVNWTKDEQKHLEEALCYYKYIKDVNKKWSEIAKHVGNGRTVKQCIDRYKYCRSIVLNSTNVFNEDTNKILNEDKGELIVSSSHDDKLVQIENNMNMLKLNSFEHLVLDSDSFYSISTLVVAVLRIQIYCERCNDISEFRPISIPGNHNFNSPDSCSYDSSDIKSIKGDSKRSDSIHDSDSCDSNIKEESRIITTNNIFDNLVLGGSQNCKKCSIKHTIRFSPIICHTNNNRIGKIEFTNCYLRDILPLDVLISCSNCNFYIKLREFIIGKLHSTNCRNCFKELSIKANGINLGSKVFNIDKSTDFLFDELLKSKGREKRKKDKDSKIPTSIGYNLPNKGTCSHYKKSNRWMRFPCCNKVYPCHNCHDKENLDHISEWANNMICGFCSREQTFSDNCKYCKSNLVGNKGSAGGRFWEGGKGCRNALTLSNRDSRKKKLLARQIKSKL